MLYVIFTKYLINHVVILNVCFKYYKSFLNNLYKHNFILEHILSSLLTLNYIYFMVIDLNHISILLHKRWGMKFRWYILRNSKCLNITSKKCLTITSKNCFIITRKKCLTCIITKNNVISSQANIYEVKN